MKALVITGADYSTLRSAVPASQLPPVGRRLKSILSASKYNATTGVLIDALGEDFTSSSFVVNGEKPVISNPTAFGSKPAISFAREAGKRKNLRGTLNLVNNKWTMTFCIVNNAALATNSNRVLFEFVSPLVNGEQRLLKFYSTGSAGVCRLLISKVAGALNFADQSNVTTNSTSLLQASVNNTRLCISLVADVVAQTVSVYVNGVFSQTVSVAYLIELTGDLYLGVALTVGTETSDFYGAIGEFILHDDALNATEIAAVHATLATAFS